jgi:hypothetical protein
MFAVAWLETPTGPTATPIVRRWPVPFWSETVRRVVVE